MLANLRWVIIRASTFSALSGKPGAHCKPRNNCYSNGHAARAAPRCLSDRRADARSDRSRSRALGLSRLSLALAANARARANQFRREPAGHRARHGPLEIVRAERRAQVKAPPPVERRTRGPDCRADLSCQRNLETLGARISPPNREVAT